MKAFNTILFSIITCAGFFLVACGSSPPPETPHAPGDAHDVAVQVVAPTNPIGQALAQAVEAKLVADGFTVVADSGAEHELTANIAIETREEHGLVTVYVNGRPKVNHIAHATLSVRSSGVTVQTATAEFDADDAIPADAVTSLAAAVESPVSLAEARRTRASRKQSVAKAESDEKAAAQAEEDAAWNQVVLAECTSPTRPDGCDPLKAFLTRFPTGTHAANAHAALEKGTAALATLSDERDWTSAGAATCKAPAASSDCEALVTYLTAHPRGAHAAEAREILDQVASKLDSLRKKEEHAQAQETKRAEDAEKREEREACKKQCMGEVCFSLKPGPFEICMDRCVKSQCE